MHNIIVVIPYKDEPLDMIMKAERIHRDRAGVPVTVHMIHDVDGIGPFAIHNRAFRDIPCDFYIYSAVDTFPGRLYAKIAYETIQKTRKGVLAFNSGKWFGQNASVGMVRSSYIKDKQNGILFYPKYKHHGGDPELSERAMKFNQFVYEPLALLIEVDYEKDYRIGLHPADQKLFNDRKAIGFPEDYNEVEIL